VVITLVIAAVALVVLYPILLLVINSFQVGQFGQATTWGLENWRAALTESRMQQAIGNTITLTATRQGIAFVVGVALAWLIARTDLPKRNWLEFGFWVTFFLPTLTVMLGWILLFDGNRGLVNQLLLKLPFVTTPPFEIFSWWGIVWVHLMTATVSIKVLLLTPAFRNMDAALEEASLAAGASSIGTLIRIVVPVMAPAILVVMLLSTIKSIEAFEIELVLGSKERIDVYSTLIYRQVFQQPPEYGTATALGLIVLLLMLPFVGLQQWLVNRRSHTTVSGKYAARRQRLGRWRWPLFGIVAGALIIMAVLPVILVVLTTFMKLFGFFTLEDPWTLNHWQATLGHPRLLNALRNTLVLGIGAALLAMVVFAGLAYICVKTRHAARGTLDFLTWLPSTIPGVVMGLGFLWLFLETPAFRSLYGTIFILIVVVALASMTLGVQILKANLVQLGAELEEASLACGASWFYTFRRIIVPLIAPALAVVAVLVFTGAARATSLVALLSVRSNQPLSMLQLDYLADGSYERAAVVGVIILALTIGIALVARAFGLRLGPSNQAW
jgi:iron(III) transport system permease protein